jgi:CBS domain containing-hemolysin-like protein
LYEGSIDNIRGVVHLKDLLCPAPGEWDVRRVIRNVPMVPETASVAEVFARLQREQQPIAVVLDEYGGTAGMVTTDDVIAAIFGELQDEFDTEGPPVQALPGSRLLVRGDTRVGELNEWFDLILPADDADTIGGLVQSRLGRVPRVGDEVVLANVAVRVERMDGHAVAAVGMTVAPEQIARWRERGA